MDARSKRLKSDYEQIRKNFSKHKNIIVTPADQEIPESYHVTYFVNGIYLKPDGQVEMLNRHEVDIILTADYPRYKPICKITTPIWHPNFRDGQICIGDIWGAGESLSDIIINIGDMIQYKSWNSGSPLSADAADWALENKHLFPVGNLNLNFTDYESAKDTVEIDLFDDNGDVIEDETSKPDEGEEKAAEPSEGNDTTALNGSEPNVAAAAPTPAPTPAQDSTDFDITPEELEGVTYVPMAQRMQTVQHGGMVKGGGINIKAVLLKGLLWAFIGAVVGFILQEVLKDVTSSEKLFDLFYSKDDFINNYTDYASLEEAIKNAYRLVGCLSTAIFAACIALPIGLFMGIGEGVYYGSASNAAKYGAIGAGISAVLGFISGGIAQWLYVTLLPDDPNSFMSAFIRGLGWGIMGIGIGLAIGLIKPSGKRILFCTIGGFGGAFIGGLIFNYISTALSTGENDTGTFPRMIGIVVMGLLIGVGIGLLEQFAKAAWLKVVRGEFEGKEYLVFAGTTSIGNNGKNTIVLFKDKLVGPHHCDIVLEGSKYVLKDCGTPMGTVVNGMKVTNHILRKGDSIAIGNSVLVFNTK